MKEIDASIDRGEGGEEKEKERKEKESVYTEIFSILNKNGLGKGKTDLKRSEEHTSELQVTRLGPPRMPSSA